MKETNEMVWLRVKEGREDNANNMLEVRVQGKRRTGRPKKRWLDNIRDDMKECNMTKSDIMLWTSDQQDVINRYCETSNFCEHLYYNSP